MANIIDTTTSRAEVSFDKTRDVVWIRIYDTSGEEDVEILTFSVPGERIGLFESKVIGAASDRTEWLETRQNGDVVSIKKENGGNGH